MLQKVHVRLWWLGFVAHDGDKSMILFGTPVMVFDDVLDEQELKEVQSLCVEICSNTESSHPFDCDVYSTFGSYNILEDERFCTFLTKQKERVVKFAKIHEYDWWNNIREEHSWLNRTEKHQYQESHKHSPSTFSCCFYPIIPQGSAPLVFVNEVQTDTITFQRSMHPNLQHKHRVKTVENRLIVFPSWQFHYVPHGRNTKERYSIASNYSVLPPDKEDRQ